MVSGHLSMDEMEERMRAINRARTRRDLAPLTSDLPDVPRPVTTPAGSKWNVSLLGDVRRGGWITVGGHMRGATLIGDVVLDLSSADIPPEGVEVTGIALIGSVRVIVPDGARVVVDVVKLLGDRVERISPPTAGGPLIRVTGFVAIGDVGVYSLSQLPANSLAAWWRSIRGGQ